MSGESIEVKTLVTNGGIVAIIAMGWEITERLTESLGRQTSWGRSFGPGIPGGPTFHSQHVLGLWLPASGTASLIRFRSGSVQHCESCSLGQAEVLGSGS